MSTSEARNPLKVWHALVWSLKGLRSAWRREFSFRLEVCAVVLLFPLGLMLGNGPVEKVLLCGSLLLVLSVELVNSSIEAVVDHICPEIHEFAARAKDMGSAAVFLLMMNVLLSWALILWSRFGS